MLLMGMLCLMGLPATKHRVTAEEYLRLEETSIERHEFHDGTIVMMPAGTPEHSLIVSNVNGEVRQTLKGKPCRAYDSGLKVGFIRTNRFVYPDVLVVCGQPQFDARTRDRRIVVNPRVVVEVLSPSTEAYDRGDKFSGYREIESFEEYVLISQSEASVQTFFRQKEGTWLAAFYSGMQAVVTIRSLGIELPMTEIYAGVEFQPLPERVQEVE